ncbi:hypothetical protein AWB81_02431 [Caballeronia arationis]|jgi:hypothetical protein|uniref:DUF2866 domain-containing protein n=1 Tax=Caballeronia arationis TaxID=1777142 RepID=A0A7Z7I5N6_9BURK|nr:DUF2866 domain-containing protein [Caballeronia arationis]SAK64406.1 hypothetical protein AWB81_02431 [Caballeronia arationis]SOE63370.1 Protein of unknown function [Caballeronia arationis]
MSANASSRNLASEMKSQHALALHECRLSAPFDQPWGPSYRLVEWVVKNDPCIQRRAVPADCTTSDIAEVLRSHVPGRRYGPADGDAE